MAVKILNEQQKQTAYRLFSEGKTKALIARHFNVSSDTITRVLKEQEFVPSKNETYSWIFADDVLIDPALKSPVLKCHTLCINNPKNRDNFSEENDLFVPGILKVADLELSRIVYAPNHDNQRSDITTHVKTLRAKPIKQEPESKPEVVKQEPELENLVWNANSKFISITVGTKTYNAGKDHDNFTTALNELSKAMSAISEGDVQKEQTHVKKALDLINTRRAIKSYTKGNIKIEGSTLYYKDLVVDSGLTRKIIEMMKEGKDFEFLLPFLENLMLNPSRKAVARLYDFLMATDIEITEDGHFIAWKYVRNDYKDCFSGTFDNSPGKRVEVPRNTVDEDDNVTCSSGLHVCSESYIGAVGNRRIVSVKVHPRDVVSIPVDYNDAKMRTCGYTVLEDVTETFKKRFR